MAGKAGGSAITIQGAVEISKALRKLPERIAKKVVRQSIREGLKPVKNAVRTEAPYLTGRTKKAVKIKAWKRKKWRIGASVRIGAGDYLGETYYAAFVQYGTVRRAADPFMTRAYEQTGDRAKAETMRLIREGTEREIQAVRVR